MEYFRGLMHVRGREVGGVFALWEAHSHGEATHQYILRTAQGIQGKCDWSFVSTSPISDDHNSAVILMGLTWSRARSHRSY